MADFGTLVEGLRAAAEPTRLRLLALLARAELTVSEITGIVRQSQPRVSRHLKLLTDAGLVDRYREGAWVFYRVREGGSGAALRAAILAQLPDTDAVVFRDLERLDGVRAQRAAQAQLYFAANAPAWSELRALHVAESQVEAAILALVTDRRFARHLDIGTGTGRILELVSPWAEHGLGIDLSPDMLGIARARLDRAGLTKAQVRLADLFDVPAPAASFDLVTVHQVLHYLDEPGRAVAEAARVLKPGGRLLIADFAPHAHEALRSEHQHRRLGFARAEVEGWLGAAGLTLSQAVDLPPAQADGLTVSLWLAQSPAHASSSAHQEAQA